MISVYASQKTVSLRRMKSGMQAHGTSKNLSVILSLPVVQTGMAKNPLVQKCERGFFGSSFLCMTFFKDALLCISVCLLLSCCMSRNKESDNILFTTLDSLQTKIGFINHLSDTGSLNILEYLYYYNGAGVAAGDVNNDGFTDLYFVSNQGKNKLFINEGKDGKLFSFKDISISAGVQGLADWQTGVTMADVNGDGWLDIYVCAVAEFKGIKGRNELYINNGLNEAGEVTFTEMASEYGLDFSGFSTQAVFFDYDKDGDLDMYLLNHAVHTSRSYDLASTRVIADKHSGDRLFENQLITNGNAKHNASTTFIDVSSKAGIYQASMGYGLGVVVADLNNDGWDDIYVANDFHEDDYYYINNQDGTFKENMKDYFGHVSRFSMGCDAADINNDGYQDLMTLDMYPEDETVEKSSAGDDPFEIFLFKLQYGYYYQYSRNSLQINVGGKAFSDRSLMAGVAATDWSWSTLMADFDNDGIKDIFITNGIVHRPNDLDYIKFISNNSQRWTQENASELDKQAIGLMPEGKVHNYLFKGRGDVRFEDKSISWGFGKPTISNGAAYADLDNDGDLDIITNNINEPAGIYQNNTNEFYKNAFLKIKLHGNDGNTLGIGAKVYLKHKGVLQLQQLMLTRGFLSSSEPILNFGLGNIDSVDTLIVVWGNQRAQLKTNLPVNTVIELNQHEAVENSDLYQQLIFQKTLPLVEDITNDHLVDYRHEENRYYDFEKEPLIPFQLSTEGPRVAIGDVNGDGLDDFYVGGARNQAGKLFIQQPGVKFSSSSDEVFRADSGFEDVDAIFFDADGDGDMDLYVVSGGNEFFAKHAQLLDRMYFNDGHGNFERRKNSLPLLYANKSCVKVCDFDNDGDMDLFIGGRVDFRYGYAADSYLLINDGNGNFSDQTDLLAPGLKKAGMVTDAHWFDWDGDGDFDLIMVGDWMPIRIFKNEHHRLKEVTDVKGLEQSNGFWQTIHAEDLDNDGDIDFLVGNLGTNTKLRKASDASLRLYVKDFDNNGNPDPILAYPIGSAWYPAIAKDELSKQLPLIKKKFTDYKSFAGKSLNEIFDKNELAGAQVLTANRFESIFLENVGSNQFRQHPLPQEAQVSKVFAFYTEDLNGDGHREIILGGNFYGASMYQGRYDASFGLILKNRDDSTFHSLSSGSSGLFLTGEVRDIKALKTPEGKILLVARNNLPVQFYRKTNTNPKTKSNTLN